MYIIRTTIPYKGREIYGTNENRTYRKIRKRNGTGNAFHGTVIPVTPMGTASCVLSSSSLNINAAELPYTANIEVIATVENQRVQTYVQTDGITGARPSMTITVTDNGTDHTVLNITFPANFIASDRMAIPVLATTSLGANIITAISGQTLEQAFLARTVTTKKVTLYLDYNILHEGSNGMTTRGPVAWTSALARRFSNGQGPLEEDKRWMDLCTHAGNTYKCITSYTQTAGSTWDSVKDNWEMDNSFSISANHIDITPGETIKLNENEISFRNSSDEELVSIGTSGISTSADITAATITGIEMKSDHISISNPSSPDEYRSLPVTPLDMKMCFITDWPSVLFEDIEGEWYFNGVDTHVSSSEYNYINSQDSQYYFSRYPDNVLEGDVATGVFDTDVVKQNDTIYFQMDTLVFFIGNRQFGTPMPT